jgi:peptidyl-tRNA hydrolase, PTH1 family
VSETVLVVGLGNPGPKYELTRHNVGWLIVDALADELGVSFTSDRAHRAETCSAQIGDKRVLIVKPQTFMNLSGESVGLLARYHKVAPTDVIAVHDEVDLPFDDARIKRGGGEGGHNGLRSLTQHLGTREYVRFRYGVGRPPARQGTAEYVLSNFGSDELDKLNASLPGLVERLKTLITDGFEQQQAQIAKPPPSSRRIKMIASVPAGIETVWDLWTTPEGVKQFFAPAVGEFGADPGDPYEILFNPSADEGARGNEGGALITVDPPKRLAFTWTAPPEIPELRDAGERTRVSLQFKRKGADATLVTLTQTGFGESEAWDQNLAYFEEAWKTVLQRLDGVCAGKVMDWSSRQLKDPATPEV